MAESISKIHILHAAQDLRLDEILKELPKEASTDKKIQVIALEISGYHRSLRNMPSKYVLSHFEQHYPYIQDTLDFSRRYLLMILGFGFRILDSSKELKDRLNQWTQKNQGVETLLLPFNFISVLPPEISMLKNLRIIDFGENRIVFLPFFLKTLPKLEKVLHRADARPLTPHAPYGLKICCKSD